MRSQGTTTRGWSLLAATSKSLCAATKTQCGQKKTNKLWGPWLNMSVPGPLLCFECECSAAIPLCSPTPMQLMWTHSPYSSAEPSSDHRPILRVWYQPQMPRDVRVHFYPTPLTSVFLPRACLCPPLHGGRLSHTVRFCSASSPSSYQMQHVIGHQNMISEEMRVRGLQKFCMVPGT